MSTAFDQLTLEDFRRTPGADKFFFRMCPRDHTQFIEILYDDLMEIFSDLEKTANMRQKDNEDKITTDICINLRRLSGYKAWHDGDASGHVDLTVEHSLKNHSWIAEAKIFRSTSEMIKGFKQLTTRYKHSYPENKGAMLAYQLRPLAAKLMGDWKSELEAMKLDGFQVLGCTRRPELQFTSTHTHETTGLPFVVWHTCLCLNHDPQV